MGLNPLSFSMRSTLRITKTLTKCLLKELLSSALQDWVCCLMPSVFMHTTTLPRRMLKQSTKPCRPSSLSPKRQERMLRRLRSLRSTCSQRFYMCRQTSSALQYLYIRDCDGQWSTRSEGTGSRRCHFGSHHWRYYLCCFNICPLRVVGCFQ